MSKAPMKRKLMTIVRKDIIPIVPFNHNDDLPGWANTKEYMAWYFAHRKHYTNTQFKPAIYNLGEVTVFI